MMTLTRLFFWIIIFQMMIGCSKETPNKVNCSDLYRIVSIGQELEEVKRLLESKEISFQVLNSSLSLKGVEIESLSQNQIETMESVMILVEMEDSISFHFNLDNSLFKAMLIKKIDSDPLD